MPNTTLNAMDELQIKLSFQEQLSDALNTQIGAQELRILELERCVRALSKVLANMDRSSLAEAGKDEPPPHY
jgi:uncharacterized coiled-coil protein SlyX